MNWRCSFRSTLRLFPTGAVGSQLVDVFLTGEGKTRNQILGAMPYEQARAVVGGTGTPSEKRYRDARQLYRTIGLVYEESLAGTPYLRVTEFGKAVMRWRPDINDRNAAVLCRHAAFALAACQLHTPFREGRDYPLDKPVFPFRFIWQAMLALDGRITSDELNRAIFRTDGEESLQAAIAAIRESRETGNPSVMGSEVVPAGDGQNDRILVWVAWASFGWKLIRQKSASADGESYTIAPWAVPLLEDAVRLKYPYRSFNTEADYVEHISRCAGLPPDLR